VTLAPGEQDARDLDVDVVIVGAGMAGLYALHHLRQLGFSAVILDAASGVGGTWFWNRYPGARCDVPSIEYSYGFSAELEQEWEWSEIFPAQEELERYFNHVADRFDLRRDIRLNTRVRAAIFDEDASVWVIETERGERVVARFCIMATGPLSAPNVPEIPGRELFRGEILMTSRWPRDGVDLAGTRVGLIGTGSSGVQTTPELAAVARHLYVFQRTPTFTWPSRNGPLDPEVQREWNRHREQNRRLQREVFGGVTGSTGAIIVEGPGDTPILESTEAERLTKLEARGFDASRAWSDTATNAEANELAAELYREMVRRTVRDPAVAEALSPRGFPIGCKRPVVDSGYFETFNRDNVTLVDLHGRGVERITETGVDTAGGHYELDVIVFATGFDALTGSLERIDIRGRDGVALREVWADGPRTYLGLQVVGFPNLFTVTGPGSPSVLANMVVCSEQHVEWIGACLAYVREHGFTTIEPAPEAQDGWAEHVNAVAQGTMFTAPTCNSWYLGANIPGKPRVFLPYVGGLPAYIEKTEAVAANGYEGFVLARSSRV
jgi:cyclohexanone monooxygenase